MPLTWPRIQHHCPGLCTAGDCAPDAYQNPSGAAFPKLIKWRHHCGSGGTGRRARLRILWPKGRGGSNPSFRTKLSDKESLARANIASRGTFSDDLPDGWCCYSSFVQRARTTVVSRAIRPVGFGQHASGKARGVRQTRHAACGRRASSSLGTSCRANGE